MTDNMDNPTTDGTTDRPDEQPDDHETTDRYGMLDTGNDTVLLYDRENPAAWIQADVALASPEIR